MSEPKRISELVPAAAITPTAQIAVVNSAGETVRVSAQIVADLFVPNLTKADVGLAEVDNTSDQDKPISIAVSAALALKAAANHQHLVAAITDFTPAVKALIAANESVSFVTSEW